MSSVRYWLWLSSLCDIGAVKAALLLEHFGSPLNVHSATAEDYKEVDGLSPRDIAALSQKSLAGTDKILADCEIHGIKILTMQDAAYPERLRNISSPPVVLYVKGVLPAMDEEPALALIGTRRPSAYGLSSAQRLAFSLAASGALIVSGMARGVDSAAHEGALRAGGQTVAVLGCGLDICYPLESRALYDEIPGHGALVSEYPPGSPPAPQHFPARNRIISGLCDAVIIVEAPEKSGALITADLALAQGRDVFAVPGNIDSPASAGSNALIREGGACAATSAADILSEYAAKYPLKIDIKRAVLRPAPTYQGRPPAADDGGALRVAQNAPAILAEAENPVEQKLLSALSSGARHIDALILAAGEPAHKVSTALTMLEVRGIIKQLPGKLFEITGRGDGRG